AELDTDHLQLINRWVAGNRCSYSLPNRGGLYLWCGVSGLYRRRCVERSGCGDQRVYRERELFDYVYPILLPYVLHHRFRVVWDSGDYQRCLRDIPDCKFQFAMQRHNSGEWFLRSEQRPMAAEQLPDLRHDLFPCEPIHAKRIRREPELPRTRPLSPS